MKKIKSIVILGNSVPYGISSAVLASKAPADCGNFNSGEPFAELFPKSGDSYDTNRQTLADSHAVIMQSGGAPVGDNAMRALMLAHNARSRDVQGITMIMPFLPFMRQDRDFEQRFCSVGAVFYAEQLKAAGVDRVVTLTPHSQAGIKAFEKVFGDGNFIVQDATTFFRDALLKLRSVDVNDLCIGAPDGADKPNDEGQRRARALCAAVHATADGSADEKRMFLIGKVHTADSATRVTSFKGDVMGKTCVIIDDMIDGGSTMINAAKALKDRGAARVICMATHGIFSSNGLGKMLSAQTEKGADLIDSVVVSDSIPDILRQNDSLFDRQPAWKARVTILPQTQALLESTLAKLDSVAAAPKAAPRKFSR